MSDGATCVLDAPSFFVANSADPSHPVSSPKSKKWKSMEDQISFLISCKILSKFHSNFALQKDRQSFSSPLPLCLLNFQLFPSSIKLIVTCVLMKFAIVLTLKKHELCKIFHPLPPHLLKSQVFQV